MDKEQLKDMANRIKESRKKIGFTQENVAEIIGISTGSYTRIENSFQKPSLDTIIKISKLLNVSIDYLVFGNESDLQDRSSNLSSIITSIIVTADSSKLLYSLEVLNSISNVMQNYQKNEVE